MSRARKQAIVAIMLFVGIVVIDQCIKIAVKTGMYLHESIRVTDWFYLNFIENNGMAFGWDFFDKYLLTLCRIVLVVAIVWFIARHIRRGITWGYLICLTLVVAGAAGNIIDCVFYGMVFNNPPMPLHAEFVPFGTGYSTLFLGKVVDMFYFPLVEWNWPRWLPFVGGDHFVFFSPVFNFADAAITSGIIAIILFHRNRLYGAEGNDGSDEA